MLDPDHEIRSAAFAYVAQVTGGGEDPVTSNQLKSFIFQGETVHLVGQPGIFKPRAMQLPISIRTAYRAPGEPRPYEDEEDANGFLLYRYRGTDPNHYDNRWLR